MGYLVSTEDHFICKDDEWETCIFICNICNYKCHTSEELTSHVLMHNTSQTKSEYVCKVCGEQFERAQILSHHFKVTHQKPKLICNICGCPCANETALLAHYKKHEPKAFACDVCNAEYDNAVSLNNHIKTHATTLLYACNKCGAGFSRTSEISIHLRAVHAKPERDRVQANLQRVVHEGMIVSGGQKTSDTKTKANSKARELCKTKSDKIIRVRKQNRKKKK